MEALHRGLEATANDERQNRMGRVKGPFDGLTIGPRRPAQDIVDDLATITRVADADPEPVETPLTAECGDDIPKAVVSPMATAAFQTDGPWRQIDVVMDDEQSIDRDAIVFQQGGDGRPAPVHEGLRFEQPAAPAGDLDRTEPP